MEDSDDEVIDLTGEDEVQVERRRRSVRLINKNIFRSPPTASSAAISIHASSASGDDNSTSSRFSAGESTSSSTHEVKKQPARAAMPSKRTRKTEIIKSSNTFTALSSSDDDSSTSSRFSAGVSTSRSSKKTRKTEIIKSSNTLKDNGIPTVTEEPTDVHYLGKVFGEKLWINKKNSHPKQNKHPFEKVEYLNGVKHELLCSKFVVRKGKAYHYEDMKKKYYKPCYLNCDGIPLADVISSISDFETLTYNEGPEKAIARLQLLLSPACKSPDSKKIDLIHLISEENFEVFQDNGHEGTGRIPQTMIPELLGGARGEKITNAVALQTRLVAPTMFGLAKGVFVVAPDIDKIMIPTSMIKCEKSKSSNPLHPGDVMIIVSGCFLSDRSITIERILNCAKGKLPSVSGLMDLEPPPAMYQNVLISRGVNRDDLDEYLVDFKNDIHALIEIAQGVNAKSEDRDSYLDRFKTGRWKVNHASVVGVADPTDSIPQGYVFVTGLCALGERTPNKIFITRPPCTDGSDGMVVQVVQNESDLIGPNASAMFKFLSNLTFCAVIFPLGIPSLPSRINDGDCDGDLYFILWNEKLVAQAENNYEAVADEFVYENDALVGTSVCCEGEGNKQATGVVVGKATGKDMYLVEVESKSKKNRMEVWPKERIMNGRGYIKRVIGHEIRNTKTVFHIEWEGGYTEHKLSSDIRNDDSKPPFELVEYVERHKLLKNKDCGWFRQHLDERCYTKTLSKITGHRKLGGVWELCCLYDDDVLEWEPLDLHMIESKLLVGKYAKDNDLFDTSDWSKTRTFWLEEIQETLMLNRSHATNLLVQRCHGRWMKSFKDYGPNASETKIWGQSYKKANELEKHVGTIKLPLELYRQMVGKNERKCKFLSLIEPIYAYVWPPLHCDGLTKMEEGNASDEDSSLFSHSSS